MILQFIGNMRRKRKEAIEKRKETGEKTGIKNKLKAEKTILVMLVLLILVRVVIGLGGTAHDVQYVPITMAGEDLYLEYCEGKASMKRGLRNRPGLMENGGMLFDLKEVQNITVTMNQINFPLKVITLDPNFKVLEVQTMEPGQSDVSFKEPCLYFAEVHPDVTVTPGDLVREFKPEFSLLTKSLVKSGVF